MTVIFWFICVCMLLLALVFVLSPVIRRRQIKTPEYSNTLNIQVHRDNLHDMQSAFNEGIIDKDEFNSARHEIESDLLTDIGNREKLPISENGMSLKTIILNMLVLPVFSVTVYMMLGDIGLISVKTAVAEQVSPPENMHSVEEMVTGLEARLQTQPDDGEGWRMLGRSYLVMNKYLDAANAYGNARKILGDDPQLLADYSEALILSNNNVLTSDAVELVNLSLENNPDEPKALWIAGYANFEQGNIPETLSYWERLLKILPPGSNESRSLLDNINQIRRQAGMEPAAQDQDTDTKVNYLVEKATRNVPNQPVSASAIDVQVSLDTSLSDRADPDNTVFIFARASEGPRMPLAIIRKQVKDLPIKVTLDDSLAMSPAMSLSKFRQVIIGARVSRSGNAMPASGDLTGTSAVVQLDEVTGVKISIDNIIP